MRKAENFLAIGALTLLVFLPVLEMVLRTFFRSGLFGQSGYIRHLVLTVAFVGAMITAREGRHLSMGGGTSSVPFIGGITRFLAVMVTTTMGWSALSFALVGFPWGERVGIVPIHLFIVMMPVAFFTIAWRMGHAPEARSTLAVLISGFAAGTFLGISPLVNMFFVLAEMPPLWLDTLLDVFFQVVPPISGPLIILLVISAFFGTPLFVVLSGTALFLFAGSDGFLEVVPNEGYTVLINSNIAAIPLFTLTGYILSESRAGERLVDVFQSLVGWLPGGTVVAAVVASVFFTSFTGASGVTILALGGLLYYILHTRGQYSEGFSIGILTTSSNIGLLFPPSLAIIIYGTIAQINIFHLFLGGIIPGIFLILSLSTIGVIVSVRNKIPSVPFDKAVALRAIRTAAGELLLPVVIMGTYFSGLTNLVETAALSVVYVILLESLIRRDVAFSHLPKVALKSIVIVGGVLIILAAARGLAFYIIDAQVPIALRDWVSLHIQSPLLFLLLLNVALLITGCLMDIFSATLIVAPLVIPLGAYFGIDPVHLGVIFIANLGLGFITPPVGIDLFLASYRFEKPLSQVYRHVLPLFLVQLVILLGITYIPFLATFLPRLVTG